MGETAKEALPQEALNAICGALHDGFVRLVLGTALGARSEHRVPFSWFLALAAEVTLFEAARLVASVEVLAQEVGGDTRALFEGLAQVQRDQVEARAGHYQAVLLAALPHAMARAAEGGREPLDMAYAREVKDALLRALEEAE